MVDFAGTAPQQPGNVNCPIAVTRSAVYYVVRMVCAPGPAGVRRRASRRSRCARRRAASSTRGSPAAVVAGNMETSSRIVDVVMAAFGEAVPVPAMGQGTMNNVSFGNERFGYYETIARRPGRVPGCGRAETRCTWRCRTR